MPGAVPLVAGTNAGAEARISGAEGRSKEGECAAARSRKLGERENGGPLYADQPRPSVNNRWEVVSNKWMIVVDRRTVSEGLDAGTGHADSLSLKIGERGNGIPTADAVEPDKPGRRFEMPPKEKMDAFLEAKKKGNATACESQDHGLDGVSWQEQRLLKAAYDMVTKPSSMHYAAARMVTSTNPDGHVDPELFYDAVKAVGSRLANDPEWAKGAGIACAGFDGGDLAFETLYERHLAAAGFAAADYAADTVSFPELQAVLEGDNAFASAAIGSTVDLLAHEELDEISSHFGRQSPQLDMLGQTSELGRRGSLETSGNGGACGSPRKAPRT